MLPANCRRTQDLEQNLLREDEKHPQPFAPAPSPPRSISSRMPSIRQFLCALLLVSALAMTLVSAFPSNRLPLRASAEDQQKFQELLDTVDTTCLHDILHKYIPEKYKHGVFPEDRKAIAAIHESNAAEASSLIELAKRQSSNVTTSEPPATSTATVIQTTEVPTVSTVIQTTTPGSTQVPVTPTVAPTTQEVTTEVTTTAVVTEATTPVNTPTTQEASTPTTPAPTTAVPTTVETSTVPVVETTTRETTAEAPGTTTTAGPTTARPTTSGATTRATTTRATTTRARSTSSRTSSVVFTTTFADGGVSTVTSVTVIAASTIAGDSGEDGGSTPTGTDSGSASLQTNGAQNIKAGMVFGMMGVFVAGVL
ncbi:hypothetical protein PVAG01_01759 [Phlyctema vagabunda]|uniref:Uncharacterized protein n=1 Tax=Phlyctema vagabunda TaxID=108571 RepID=A0ABR4PXZ8_9HELO